MNPSGIAEKVKYNTAQANATHNEKKNTTGSVRSRSRHCHKGSFCYRWDNNLRNGLYTETPIIFARVSRSSSALTFHLIL